MPQCAVPGCSSGCPSSTEKIAVFGVPRNKSRRQQWDAVLHALPGGNLSAKGKYHVCEKHFLKQQVSRKRELQDDMGNVLGVVSIRACLFTRTSHNVSTGTVHLSVFLYFNYFRLRINWNRSDDPAADCDAQFVIICHYDIFVLQSHYKCPKLQPDSVPLVLMMTDTNNANIDNMEVDCESLEES